MRSYPLKLATTMCKNCMFVALLPLGAFLPPVVPVAPDKS